MRISIPKPVVLSVGLLLATHAVGLWQMISLSRTLGVALWMPYGMLALVYSLLVALLAMILLGKFWARATYTVLGVLGLLSIFGHIVDLDATGWLAGGAKVAALVLLYVPASNSWFMGASPDSSFKPTQLRGAA